ncbi:MAG: YicC family protein [Planctomycetaceae bacterium]|nr:YicC family protein [Planctomycetaceae bacterium]
MLLSMTGHGDATGQSESLSISVEVRSVNNRHLKVSFRAPDAFLALESQVEKVVRQRVSRGSLYINMHVQRLDDQPLNRLHDDVLRSYWEHLTELGRELAAKPADNLGQLLDLPGVVDAGASKQLEESDWPLVEQVLGAALDKLQTFRNQEGSAMVRDLRELFAGIEAHVVQIADRAPNVVRDYRERIRQRLTDLTADVDIQWTDSDLIRELSLFADRCDITEEITRLRSHLGQFESWLQVNESAGRKLDFLCQELFREINTIGSKANDITLSHHVVEVKAIIEKIREIVQNVE